MLHMGIWDLYIYISIPPMAPFFGMNEIYTIFLKSWVALGPPGDQHIPLPVGTFESMIFLFPFGGICDRSLEGNPLQTCNFCVFFFCV